VRQVLQPHFLSAPLNHKNNLKKVVKFFMKNTELSLSLLIIEQVVAHKTKAVLQKKSSFIDKIIVDVFLV